MRADIARADTSLIKISSIEKLGVAVAACTLLNACTLAPSVNVLGAYFPGWLFCIVAGVSLTVVVDVIQSKKGLGHWLAPAALTYPVLTTLFSLCTWLIFFEN